MNVKKKCVTFLMAILLCVSAMAVPAFAASVSQDGLEVMLSTDKNSYKSGEQIVVTLKVSNTNDKVVTDVFLNNIIPEGFELSSNSEVSKEISTIQPDEVVTLTSTYVESADNETAVNTGREDGSDGSELNNTNSDDKDNNKSEVNNKNNNTHTMKKADSSAKTGDTTHVEIWMILLVVSILVIVVLFAVKKKKSKQILSIILCLFVFESSFLGNPLFAKAANNRQSISISEKIDFNGNIVDISSEVEYRTINEEEFPTASLYTVSFDTNGGNQIEPQTIESGMTATEPEIPIREGYTFIGWYLEKNPEDLADTFSFSTSKIVKDITLYAIWYPTVDSDGDGIIDDIEKYLGLDSENTDSDNDGVSDYLEVVVLEWNPLSSDSDNNGVSDGDEDPDNDGLINRDENAYGTNPLLMDTDDDGLNDQVEVKTYGTNALEKDTDGDGVSDAKEIELGTDPLTAEQTFTVNAVPDEKINDIVEPSVKIELSGEQVETLQIERQQDQLLFPEDMPGYMGGAYDFSVEGEFNDAVISFSFDKSKINEESAPTIYYFNESDQEFEPLETTISGNIASATVTHFSTYVLIDRTIYDTFFLNLWRDVWDSETSFTSVQIVLVIDDSGSMDQNDRNNQRLVVAQNLLDKLPENSKIGIVKFTDDVDILTPELLTDREQAKSYLNTEYFKASGGTHMYTAINSTFDIFQEAQEDQLKMMVVLSDGDSSDRSQHNETVSVAQEKNVRIYTVGLGDSSSYFTNYLEPLAQETTANFYLAENADQLTEIYNDINEKIDIETDSDQDSLPDYYEDNLILFNGKKLTLDKNNPDTDGDGKLDGEEVILKYKYNEDNTKVIVVGIIVSDPTDNPNYITVAHEIEDDNVKEDRRLTMVEWKPLEGLSQTMMAQDDSFEALVENVPVVLDTANFVLSWLNNSQEVTQLRVITGKDKTVAIKYGSSIELNLSGKKTSLSSLLVNRLYNVRPSIIFTSRKEADENIRNWFGLTGDGMYSMELDFGKVYIGDYGYYLLIENGEVYQVPIIHPDTTMKVYYTKDKETQYVFDAADVLRKTRLKLSDTEKEKVLKQLKDNGYNF